MKNFAHRNGLGAPRSRLGAAAAAQTDRLAGREVWPIVTGAWLARRRRPEDWQLIPNNLHIVRRQLEGLGKEEC